MMELHMNYVKVCGFIAGITVLFANANAIKVNDYNITLTDDLKLDKMYEQDEYRAMASEILRQHYNAHLAKVRMENKSELVQWDNETYNESVYGVILNEIARCFFNINNDMVTYNKFDGRMIECIGTDPLKYDAVNWNYVFLVNLIDRFMANTIECFSEQAYHQLFERALNDTKTVILEANEDKGYTHDYATYKDAIERAYRDIKEYCTQLQLSDYLIELMKVRLNKANISYSEVYKKDEHGKLTKELDYESARKQYKEYITKIDASPNNENGEHIDEFNSNEWIKMTLKLKGVHAMDYVKAILQDNKDAYHPQHRAGSMWKKKGKYVARKQWYIYITQPTGCGKIFKSYRMCFGKITRIGKRSDAIKEIKGSKYCKISSDNWLNNGNSFDSICAGGEYEGFHPLSELEFASIEEVDLNSLPDRTIERLQNFKMIEEHTKKIHHGNDWVTNIPIIDFRKIVRYSNNQNERINKVKTYLKFYSDEAQDIDAVLKKYKRYGDIMYITQTIKQYINYIKKCEDDAIRSDERLKSILENNSQLNEIKAKVKLLTIAQNMLPTSQNINTMAELICAIILPAQINITDEDFRGERKYDARLTTDENDDDMKQRKAQIRGEHEYTRPPYNMTIKRINRLAFDQEVFMAIINARLASLEKILKLPSTVDYFIHKNGMWEEIHRGYVSDEENIYG